MKIAKVLMVADDAHEATRIGKVLNRAKQVQFDVTHLETLADACERLAEDSYDVILLDLAMQDEPGLDGFIRINAQVPATPVVVLTAGRADLLRDALAAGAADSLIKARVEADPVEEILIEVIQRSRFDEAIQRRELMDELTGLYSRKGFLSLAPRHVNLAVTGKKSLLLCAMDLDRLSEVRSERGDQEVEHMQLEVGRILKGSFRTSDLVARFDEGAFAALAIVHPEDNAVDIVRARLRELLHDHNALRGNHLPIQLRTEMKRVNPRSSWSVDDLLASMPPGRWSESAGS